jgi:hypothetical protein
MKDDRFKEIWGVSFACLAGKLRTDLARRMLYDVDNPPPEPQERLDFPITREEFDALIEEAVQSGRAQREVLYLGVLPATLNAGLITAAASAESILALWQEIVEHAAEHPLGIPVGFRLAAEGVSAAEALASLSIGWRLPSGRRSGQMRVIQSMVQVGDFWIFDCAPAVLRLYRS